LRIGIDLMGSDASPQVLFDAVLQAALKSEASHTFVVVATAELIDECLCKKEFSVFPALATRFAFHRVTDVITMSDDPSSAIRQKKNSSLVVGIRLLKKQLIDGLISAGNTGALITGASLLLPMLPGISRPALLAMLPTNKGFTSVIDVGGNVSYKAHHLIQFAKMGIAVQRCSHQISLPSVGLLNIGVESKKGTSELRLAYQILQQNQARLPMNFKGNVEGREVLQGKVDVLVTDGFTGNVLLKTIEGTSTFILDYIKKACEFDTFPSLMKEVEDLQRHFNYDEYPGAIVCGIDRVLVKCHGNSSAKAFYNGIQGMILLIQNQLIKQFKEQL
jgi:phosphate acyltransferase